jgi:hypothetical protein
MVEARKQVASSYALRVEHPITPDVGVQYRGAWAVKEVLYDIV